MVDVSGLRSVNSRSGGGRSRFSSIEIRDIVITDIVLSFAFAIAVCRPLSNNVDSIWFAEWILLALFFVTFSFLFHELGHKYTAQFYGAWSEYRMFPRGLLFSVLISFTGFLFAAPGAVYIRGNITPKENGIISAAGPVVNFAIAAAAMLFMTFTGGGLYFILSELAYLNAFLGLFNMIPVPPLDGSKVLGWGIKPYLGTVAVGVVELAFVFLVL